MIANESIYSITSKITTTTLMYWLPMSCLLGDLESRLAVGKAGDPIYIA